MNSEHSGWTRYLLDPSDDPPDDRVAVTGVEYDTFGATPLHPQTAVRWRAVPDIH